MRLVSANFGDLVDPTDPNSKYYDPVIAAQSAKQKQIDQIMNIVHPIVYVGAGLFALYALAKIIKKA